jgi:hypothetical protein
VLGIGDLASTVMLVTMSFRSWRALAVARLDDTSHDMQMAHLTVEVGSRSIEEGDPNTRFLGWNLSQSWLIGNHVFQENVKSDIQCMIFPIIP